MFCRCKNQPDKTSAAPTRLHEDVSGSAAPSASHRTKRPQLGKFFESAKNTAVGMLPGLIRGTSGMTSANSTMQDSAEAGAESNQNEETNAAVVDGANETKASSGNANTGDSNNMERRCAYFF